MKLLMRPTIFVDWKSWTRKRKSKHSPRKVVDACKIVNFFHKGI